MKLCIRLFLISIILGVVFSCSQETFEEEFTENKEMNEGIVKFKYKDVIYTSKYTKKGNEVVYADKSVESLIISLKSNPNLSIFTHADGSHELFDSFVPLNKQAKYSDESISPTTRSVIDQLTLTVYTRTKYRGDVGRFVANDQFPNVRINLAAFNLANQITSMKLNGRTDAIYFAGRATFFEYANLQGRSHTFEIRTPNLDLGVKDFANITLSISPMGIDVLDDKTNSILLEL